MCSIQSLTGVCLSTLSITVADPVPFLRRFGVSAEPVLGKSFWSYWKKHNQTHVIEQFDPLYLFATGIVAALVQSFLAARYWLLCAFIS
jgi:hypothetical protein